MLDNKTLPFFRDLFETFYEFGIGLHQPEEIVVVQIDEIHLSPLIHHFAHLGIDVTESALKKCPSLGSAFLRHHI
jgi:hypothetical protein